MATAPTVTAAQIGFCRLVLSIDQPVVEWGSPVRGVLALSSDQRMESLPLVEVAVRSQWGDPAGIRSGSRSLTTRTVEQDLAQCQWRSVPVPVTLPLRLPFALAVPHGAPFDVDTELIARIVGAGGDSGSAALCLRVRPPRSMVTLAEQLALAAGAEVGPWRSVGTSAAVRLTPTRGVNPAWRRLELQLASESDGIRLRINVARSFLSALRRQPDLQIPAFIPVADLPEAHTYIHGLLQSLESGTLPLPAAPANEEGTGLPLPAYGAAD